MKTKLIGVAVSVACATAVLSIGNPAFAQPTREQVKADCAEWLKTHEFSEADGWKLKPGVKAPSAAKSTKTRAQTKADVDAFLKNNRWDEAKSAWVSIKGTPRDVSKMTREELKKETAEYMRTHMWDEGKGAYITCPAPK